MPEERFLVTGGTGCIGSWVVRNLVREPVPVTVLTSGPTSGAAGTRHAASADELRTDDLRVRDHRLRLILSDHELARVGWIHGDVADVDGLEAACRDLGITGIIHLAALQFPFCAADPYAGARVNVVGTVAVFELARRLRIGRVTYASSAAVYGPKSHYPTDILGPDAPFFPTSHYGVFKVANEQDARVWWESAGIASIGLRPHSAYGPGRDQGVTSKPTLAMIAAAAGKPYRINFGGSYQFQFADDVAKSFVRAARSGAPGAAAYSVAGPRIGVGEILETIEALEPAARGTLGFDDVPLAFPEAFDGGPIEAALGPQPLTPLADGIRQTIDTYRVALRSGLLDDGYLARVLRA